MVKGSVCRFIESLEDIKFLRTLAVSYSKNVEVGFRKKTHVEEFAHQAAMAIPSDYVSSVYLPKGLNLSAYSDKKAGMVHYLKDLFDVNLFVVHPWAEDLDQIMDFVCEAEDFCLCLEHFLIAYSAKNGILDLLARYGRHFQTPYAGLCVDFSHLDKGLGTDVFFKGILSYIKVIHASSRIKGAEHAPLFMRNADMNGVHILGQILNVKKLALLEIVLEYRREYDKNTMDNIFWLSDFILSKRRKWGTAEERRV